MIFVQALVWNVRTWREMRSEKAQVDNSIRLKVAMLTSGIDRSVVPLKRGNARGGRGAGWRLCEPLIVANWKQEEPWEYRGGRQPSHRWHEPYDVRASRTESVRARG